MDVAFGIDARRYILYRLAAMDTFREVIDAWPSTGAFGEETGTSDSHVRTIRAGISGRPFAPSQSPSGPAER